MIEKSLEITFECKTCETLDDVKMFSKELLKIEFVTDVSWTDDINEWYLKLTANSLEVQDDIDKYNDMLLYWKESYQHYLAQKVLIDAASSNTEALAIIYTPTHTKTREEII